MPKPEYYQEHKSRYERNYKEKAQALRLHVLLHYSKGLLRCECCGDAHYVFLTIDHIYPDSEPKGIAGDKLVRYLAKSWPPGFQVLCWNCNCSKGTGHVCEHHMCQVHCPNHGE